MDINIKSNGNETIIKIEDIEIHVDGKYIIKKIPVATKTITTDILLDDTKLASYQKNPY